MLTKAYLTLLTKLLTACVMSGGLLWLIVARLGPQTNEVVVHVWDSPVIVTIDGESYTVYTWDDQPITCELREGWHELKVWRNSVVVHQERFLVRLDANIVLGVWDRSQRPDPPTPQPSAEPMTRRVEAPIHDDELMGVTGSDEPNP